MSNTGPLVLLILGVVGFATCIINSHDANFVAPEATPRHDILTDRKPVMPPPESLVTIKKFSWSKEAFGTVMMGSFTLANANNFAVKDITIECGLSAASGTRIDSVKQTIYEIIPAKAIRNFHEVNLGFIRDQTKRASCE